MIYLLIPMVFLYIGYSIKMITIFLPIEWRKNERWDKLMCTCGSHRLMITCTSGCCYECVRCTPGAFQGTGILRGMGTKSFIQGVISQGDHSPMVSNNTFV